MPAVSPRRWTADDVRAPRPEILTASIRWLPDGVAAPLVLELEPLFVESVGEI